MKIAQYYSSNPVPFYGTVGTANSNGNDIIAATDGISFTQNGLYGNDIMIGNNFASILNGNAGNDLFYAGLGKNTLSGGADIDTFRFVGPYGDTRASGGTEMDIYEFSVSGKGKVAIINVEAIDTYKLMSVDIDITDYVKAKAALDGHVSVGQHAIGYAPTGGATPALTIDADPLVSFKEMFTWLKDNGGHGIDHVGETATKDNDVVFVTAPVQNTLGGDDLAFLWGGEHRLLTNDGHDTVIASGADSDSQVSLGSGNDTLIVSGDFGKLVANGNEGEDDFKIELLANGDLTLRQFEVGIDDIYYNGRNVTQEALDQVGLVGHATFGDTTVHFNSTIFPI